MLGLRFGWILLVSSVLCAQQLSLNLSSPITRSCGYVEVNGGFTAPGLQSTPPTWDWGDGSITKSFFPATHKYAQAGSYTIKVSILSGETVLISQTVSVTATASTSTVCTSVLTTDPARLYLLPGSATQRITVSRISTSGNRELIDAAQLKFRSLNPGLISISSAGVASATGFGDGGIEIEDPASGQLLRVSVTVGELKLDPPYLRLHLEANPQARLTVSGVNADGSPLNLSGRTIEFFDPNPPPPTPVVSVSPEGLVRALRVPARITEVPILHVRVGGVLANNTAIVRVANAFPELEFFDLTHGQVRFHAARRVGNWNYEDILRGADVARWTHRAYELEAEAAGYPTNRGGVHNLVNDIGGVSTPNDPTVPCGISGNPTRLGTDPAKASDNSCLIIANSLSMPQWFIYFHEIGHDFAGQNLRFNQWIENIQSPFTVSIVEGMASSFAQYAAYIMKLRRSEYGIDQRRLDEFEQNALFPDSQRWRNALDQYSRSGFRFADLDPDVFNAIVGVHMLEFGPDWFVRFASTLLPPVSRFRFEIKNETQAATFMAAASSAAAGQDLRDRFRAWGFPIDNSYYAAIYPELFQYSKARTPLISSGGVVSAASFKANGIAPAEWISLYGINLAPRLTISPDLTASLEGTSIEVTDAQGVSRKALIQFVSPGHANVLVPEQTAAGPAILRLTTWAGSVSIPVSVGVVHPGLFSAAANGAGPAAATWLRVRPDGSRSTGLTFDPATLKNLPIPIGSDQVYLNFFGTGFRGQSSVKVTLGGQLVPVLGAVAQGQYAGLDQLVIGPIPASLAQKGDLFLEAHFDGIPANAVSVAFQ